MAASLRFAAKSYQPLLQYDTDEFRRPAAQISHGIGSGSPGMPVDVSRAAPHAEGSGDHHRGHQILVAASSRTIFEIGVVAFAVINLDVPMRSDETSELFRSAGGSVERRNMIDDFLCRFADDNPRLPAVLRFSDLRRVCPAEGAADRLSSRKTQLHRILYRKDLRLADFQPSPVQLFFFDESTMCLQRQSVSH